ncbi:MAG TPA: CerR family C-terminal domain-containing protein [Planctomycetaceae bacterium]|nr:CerR family C-terminal domain-containing protein [Planctomycetaceae bacterium]
MSVTDDTRQRLLEAAGQVFAEKGFKASTVRDICGRIGANLAAVNYHFGDKERLYIEAVKAAHCSRPDDPSLNWPPHFSPEDKLRAFVGHMLAHILDDKRPRWHAQLMMRELAEPTSACVELVDAYIRPMAQKLGEIINELVPADTPQSQRFMTAFSVVGQCLFYKVHEPISILLVGEQEYRSYTVERLADHIARFTLAAIGRGEPLFTPTVPEHAS